MPQKKYFKKNYIILFAYSKKYYICITEQLKNSIMLELAITKETMNDGILEFDLRSETRAYWGWVHFSIDVINETIEDDYNGLVCWVPTKVKVNIDLATIESQTVDSNELKLNARNEQLIKDFITVSFMNDPCSFGYGQSEPDYDDIDQ